MILYKQLRGYVKPIDPAYIAANGAIAHTNATEFFGHAAGSLLFTGLRAEAYLLTATFQENRLTKVPRADFTSIFIDFTETINAT